MSDLRLAFRSLRRSPAITAVSIALLALGIGANALFFSAFDRVLLRPLPVGEPHALVRAVQNIPGIGLRGSIVLPAITALSEHSTSFSSVLGSIELNTVIVDPAQQIRVDVVTPNFFDALGVPSQLGRALTASDESSREGAPPAVLSYDFWSRRFNRSPTAIGQTFALNRK